MKLSSQILEILGHSSIPVSTPDMVAMVWDDRPNLRNRVWSVLQYLERNSLVTRVEKRKDKDINGVARVVTFWKLSG